MVKKTIGSQRREESLSRERIIDAAVEILDDSGEAGLTFRALSQRLETGPGAIYWHIASKGDLMTAACDAIVARTMATMSVDTDPEASIRAQALAMFDAIDDHPWVGSALVQSAGELPMLRIFEGLGQQVRALGVPDPDQWTATCTLLNYILGVSGQNANNAQFARANSLDRSEFLGNMSTAWTRLDPDLYPFTQSVAGHLRDHDDRSDFLAGVDFILRGMHPSQG